MRTHADVAVPATYARSVVTKAPAWHGFVVFDVLFNNLSAGLFLVAAIGQLAAPATFGSVAALAYPVALVLLLADLACLVLDLGDSLRFHHMLRVFKPSSPMSLGTWCLTALALVLTALVAIESAAAAGWAAADSPTTWWARSLGLVVGLPLAFGAAAYKGVLFSTTAQPGWKDARWLGAYLVNSAVMLGAGELLLIAALASEPRAVQLLRPVVGMLLALNLLALALLVGELRPLLSRLYARRELGLDALLIPFPTFIIPAAALLAHDARLTAFVTVTSLLLADLAARY